MGVWEALVVTFGFITATILYLGLTDADLALNYERGFLKIGIIALVLLLCMYYFDLYDSLIVTNHREMITRLVQVLGATCVILSILYFAYPAIRPGRAIFVLGWGLVTVLIVADRELFLVLNSSPRLAERAVLLGGGPLAAELAEELEKRPEFGIKVVGFIGEADPDFHVRHLGDSDRLEDLIRTHQVRRIIVSMRDRRGKLPVETLLQFKTRGIRVQDGAEFYESITGKLPVENLRVSWLLFSPGFRPPTALLIYKRMLSLVGSAVALVVALPLLMLIVLAIRLDSPGPAIFRQKRVGQGGKLFTLFKFRSMYDGSERKGLAPAEHGDARITRVGKWLRRTRLDELPQLVNIFRGDIYFVGPRPFVPEQEAECERAIPFYRQRWAVKPGATGWAQVNRGYNATIDDNREKLAYDLFYIKNLSVGLDLLIMFKSAKILLLGRGGR